MNLSRILIGGSVISIIPIIFLIFPQESIWDLVIKNGSSLFWGIVFGAYFLGALICYLCVSHKDKTTSSERVGEIDDLQNHANSSTGQMRYSIVLVDDMFKNQGILNKYRDRMSNYNICFLPSVSNINMLVGFDIIILDIMGTGFRMGNRGGFGDVNTYMKELFNEYPYKYIIAVSTHAEKLVDQSIVANSYCQIHKTVNVENDKTTTNDEAFISSLQESIKEAFIKLDDPVDFWQKDILDKITNKNNVDVVKKNYSYHLSLKGR